MKVAVLVIAFALAAVATVARAAIRAGDGELTLVAYSTPRETYHQLVGAFGRTPSGRDVDFGESYGASGEQSRAVGNGLPADVVAFSLEPDMSRLVDAGLVAADWKRDDFGGMVTRSVVVLVVRAGNPKRIRAWRDLLRADVDVLTPNPFTSGGARWNVMAAYGAERARGASHEAAVRFLSRLFANVSVQDKSARESMQTFVGGKGDVLLAYENEAIHARAKGEHIEWVVPDATILIENPVAVTTTSEQPEQASAFVRFLRSEHAQGAFARAGYRPVVAAAANDVAFPQPPDLFRIGDLGGWKTVQKRFFDRERGIVAEIQQQLGKER